MPGKQQASFASRLRKGERLIGPLVSLPSPEITEILSRVGFDWLFIDAEHGAFNPEQTQAMLQSAGQCPCVIRVPAGDEIWIKKALDIGAAGIIVPQVHSAEQARQIIRYSKYAPEGSRGVGIGRAHAYGINFEDYLQRANTDTAIILQAESRRAIENINDIVKVPGIDAILIGPYDLSASLGKLGKVNDPEVRKAIQIITNACHKAGIQLGIFGVDASAVNPYLDKGFRLITVGTDSLFISRSASQTLSKCHVV